MGTLNVFKLCSLYYVKEFKHLLFSTYCILIPLISNRKFYCQQCDLIITDVLALFYRSKIDLTTPWIFADLGLLIPVDDDIANTNAVIKPFQWPVFTQ